MTEVKKHKWEKIIYRSRFTSTEIYSICKTCGCKKERGVPSMKYTLNGVVFSKSPMCDSGNKQEIDLKKIPDYLIW